MRAGAASRFRARAWAPQAEFDESWDSLGRHGVGSEPQLSELVRCCSQSSTSDARTGIGALQMDDAGPGTATLDDLIFVEPTLVSGADALGSIGPPHVEVSPLRIGAIVAEPSDADPDWPELHGPDELPFSCLLRNVNCFKPERKAPGPAPPAEPAAGAAGATDFDPTDVLLRDGLLESLEAEKAAPPRAQARRTACTARHGPAPPDPRCRIRRRRGRALTRRGAGAGSACASTQWTCEPAAPPRPWRAGRRGLAWRVCTGFMEGGVLRVSSAAPGRGMCEFGGELLSRMCCAFTSHAMLA